MRLLSVICTFLFSYSLVFSDGQINDDLILAMQKASKETTVDAKGEKCETKKSKEIEKRLCNLEKCNTEVKAPCFARCECNEDIGFYFATDFLYWLVKNQANYNIAVSKPSDNDFITDIISPESDYKPGARVAVGYNISRDNWDIYLDWTWIKSHSFVSKTANEYGVDGTVVRSDINIALNEDSDNNTLTLNPVDFTKSLSKVKYNTWDFEIGKTYYPGTHLSLRPHVGVRGAWIKEGFGRFASSPLITTSIFPLSKNIHEQFWGVGLRSGLNSEWNFSKSFGIYGKLSGSLLYCEHHFVKQSHDNIGAALSAVSYLKKEFSEMKPTVQAALGFAYETCFCNSMLFSLKAGYEMNYWWDCFNVYDSSLFQIGTKALELSGLTLSARFDF